MQQLDTEKIYRYIMIVESRDWWLNCNEKFDPIKDLVLTYDLALHREITALGGDVFYIDHLVDYQMMQDNNFRTYRFFREWHLDASGLDIFIHRDIPFGFAFRIEIWNDLLSYVSASANLSRLRELQFEKLYVGTEVGLVETILKRMNIASEPIAQPQKKNQAIYYFPIARWMDEKTHPQSFKHTVMRWFIVIHSIGMSWIDKIWEWRKKKTKIFVQVYHPTYQIMQQLNKDSRIKVITGSFSRSFGKWIDLLKQRVLPMFGEMEPYRAEAEKLMKEFRGNKNARLVLADNSDITEDVYSIIESRISTRILEYLRDLNCVIDYLDRHQIQLEIMISNIGRIDTLVDCVCKKRNIPSYLIINGLLGPEYLDEGKYATVINSYSSSIKNDYFRGMSNIICLGDPRMDAYIISGKSKNLNRDCPTITIGASGFNIIDLNSYVAVEFEFLWDVLQALSNIKRQGRDLRVVIKVRSNGYREQYEAFVKEYFSDLVDEIHDVIPIRKVLEKTDLYISINSQTLFEASCLGIPCIYYKKGSEKFNPPFDGNSELVTIDSVENLEQGIMDFFSGHERFNVFLKRPIMEKYVGSLDGKNTRRNIDFIYSLLPQKQPGVINEKNTFMV